MGADDVMLVGETLLFVEMALNVVARNFGFACIFLPFFWLENYFAVVELCVSILGVIVKDFWTIFYTLSCFILQYLVLMKLRDNLELYMGIQKSVENKSAFIGLFIL
jgi:hypothetical protein